MPTFAEVQKQVTELRQRREIFVHLLDHIDTSFLPVEGKPAVNVLVTPDQVRVPETAFEKVSAEITSIIIQIDQAIQAIEQTEINPAAQPAAAPQESTSGSDQPAAADPQPGGGRGRSAAG